VSHSPSTGTLIAYGLRRLLTRCFTDSDHSRERGMKKIEAIIYPFKLDDVKKALARVGIEGFSVLTVSGFGHQKSSDEVYRGGSYVVEHDPKLKVETVVVDYKAVQVSEAIRKAARTGRVGDGEILVLPVEEAVRIRTGERGNSAIC
jgi:nitrogen regulatory protein P-II 1